MWWLCLHHYNSFHSFSETVRTYDLNIGILKYLKVDLIREVNNTLVQKYSLMTSARVYVISL